MLSRCLGTEIYGAESADQDLTDCSIVPSIQRKLAPGSLVFYILEKRSTVLACAELFFSLISQILEKRTTVLACAELFFSLVLQILRKRTTVLACIGPFFSLISQILEKWTTPLGMQVTFL